MARGSRRAAPGCALLLALAAGCGPGPHPPVGAGPDPDTALSIVFLDATPATGVTAAADAEATSPALRWLMDEATRAAAGEVEKQRVALFRKAVWDYMVDGRKKYLAKQQQQP